MRRNTAVIVGVVSAGVIVALVIVPDLWMLLLAVLFVCIAVPAWYWFMYASFGIRLDRELRDERTRASKAAQTASNVARRARPTPPNHDGKSQLIAGAKMCGAYAGRGALQPLEDWSRQMLPKIYGQSWLSENETLLCAMLTFVEEFRAITSGELRGFYAEDAPECCLLNVFNCMQHAGAFTQPTIPKGKPDVGDFILAFSGGSLTRAMADPQAPSFVMGLSVRVASQYAARKSA